MLTPEEFQSYLSPKMAKSLTFNPDSFAAACSAVMEQIEIITQKKPTLSETWWKSPAAFMIAWARVGMLSDISAQMFEWLEKKNKESLAYLEVCRRTFATQKPETQSSEPSLDSGMIKINLEEW